MLHHIRNNDIIRVKEGSIVIVSGLLRCHLLTPFLFVDASLWMLLILNNSFYV